MLHVRPRERAPPTAVSERVGEKVTRARGREGGRERARASERERKRARARERKGE